MDSKHTFGKWKGVLIIIDIQLEQEIFGLHLLYEGISSWKMLPELVKLQIGDIFKYCLFSVIIINFDILKYCY